MYEEFEPGYDWEDLIEKDIEKAIEDHVRHFYDDEVDSGQFEEDTWKP